MCKRMVCLKSLNRSVSPNLAFKSDPKQARRGLCDKKLFSNYTQLCKTSHRHAILMTPSFPLCSREEKVCKMSFLIFSSPCGFLKAKQKSEVNNSSFFSTFLSVCHKQTKLQSRSRLRASEAAVHEGHGGPAVPAEPAQHHPEEV